MKNSQIVVAFTDLELASEVFGHLVELMAQNRGVALAEWTGEKGVMMHAFRADKLPASGSRLGLENVPCP